MLYEALRASRYKVNNGEVLDTLFPDQCPRPAATALATDIDNAHVIDDSDFNYMSEEYISDVMNILTINNDDDDDDDIIENLCVDVWTVVNNNENVSECLCVDPQLLPRVDVISEVTIIDRDNSLPRIEIRLPDQPDAKPLLFLLDTGLDLNAINDHTAS